MIRILQRSVLWSPQRRSAGLRWIIAILIAGLVAAGAAGLGRAAVRSLAPMTTDKGVLVVEVRLGGLCPHYTVPPSPECKPQPLAGARLRLVDANGRAVAVGKSRSDGKVVLFARAGRYVLVAKPVQRARITPRPRPVALAYARPLHLVLTYYTGIQ
jgi:hypothetical protein